MSAVLCYSDSEWLDFQNAVDRFGANAERDVIAELLTGEGNYPTHAITDAADRELGRLLLALHTAKSAKSPDPARIRECRDAIASWGDALVDQIVASSIKAIEARAVELAKERARG